MIKKIVGIGAGVAALAAVGTFGYRHFLNKGPDAAAAAPAETSRVITIGAEPTSPQVAPGKVLISPVTPKQMPPKTSELKPKAPAATQPTAAQPAPALAAPAPAKPQATIVPALPKLAQPAKPKPATQPVAAPAAPQPKKARVISLTGEPQAAGRTGDAGAGRLTTQEKAALAMLKQLHALRAGIGSWRTQHGGQFPNFVAAPDWEQFLDRDAGGRVVGKAPVNPMNGHSRVIPINIDPAPGMPVEGPFGYVFSMKSGKLFAVDAMGRVFDESAVDLVALESKGVRELAPKDQEQYVLTVIDAVRTQIARYAQHHGGRPPDFSRYPAFEQLMKPTAADGRVLTSATPGQAFGPYILTMPINSLNSRHRVVAVPGELRPGQRIDASDAGFVYSVSTNRLFAIDAAGLVYDDAKARAGYVPADAGGTGAASTGTAANDGSAIDTLRNYLAAYQQQHDGKLPDFKRYPRWEQLTGKTLANGKPDPTGAFGPYLFKTPVNTKNNSSDVEVVGRLIKGYKPKKPVGYVFDTSTGTIYLTDELGNVVTDQ